MFCPPRRPSRLPPTKAMSARPHAALSSPMVSRRITPRRVEFSPSLSPRFFPFFSPSPPASAPVSSPSPPASGGEGWREGGSSPGARRITPPHPNPSPPRGGGGGEENGEDRGDRGRE